MPKERSHLLVAGEILEQLNNQPLQQIINRHASAYYLGAIAPDLKSYDVFDRAEFPFVADFIHNQVETKNSGLLFKMLSKLKPGSSHSEEIMVFILGYITHAVSDAVFHPLIFYFTGNLYDPDPQQRAHSLASHCYFETVLEVALFRSAGKDLNDFSPARLCQTTPARQRGIFRYFSSILAEECGENEETLYRGMNDSFSIFLKLTRWFTQPFFYYLARVVNLLTLGQWQKYIGVFHPPGKQVIDPLFTTRIEFKHPFTGENIITSVQSLNEKAIKIGASCLNAAYEVYSGKLSLEKLQSLLGSKNMNTGTHLPANYLKHCSAARF